MPVAFLILILSYQLRLMSVPPVYTVPTPIRQRFNVKPRAKEKRISRHMDVTVDRSDSGRGLSTGRSLITVTLISFAPHAPSRMYLNVPQI